MSSSDTSSEENLDLLMEAVDAEFMNDNMFAPRGTCDTYLENNGKPKEQKIPTLRKRAEEEQQYNELRVTPEFQAFVAKHLAKIIDRQLGEFHGDSTLTPLHNGNTRAQPSSGIRLFGSSSIYLSTNTMPPHKKSKRQVVPEEDEDTLKKCLAVAVSPEWVMSRKEVACWEKPSSEVLVLNTSGEVIDHKGAKEKVKTNSWGVRKDSFHIDTINSAHHISNKKKRQKQ